MPMGIGPLTALTGTMAGPSEQELSQTLAWSRYSGFSPSMVRDDMSLPATNPAILPSAAMTRSSSGSAMFQSESARIATASPGPTARQPLDLKNNSGRAASHTRS